MTSAQDREHRNPPVLHWLAAAAGVLLFIGCLIVLGYEAFATDDGPPALVASADSTVAVRGGWLVHVTVRNTGGATASNVVISGVLMDGERTVEDSEFQLDFVPERSSREGGLFFTRDPGGVRMVVRALGYAVP